MKTINVAREFSRFPAGRYKTDGPNSGERFREEFLIRALKSDDGLTVKLDGVAGYGSSFLEEAFGGLVRALHLSATDAARRIKIKSADSSLVREVEGYMEEAAKHDAGSVS